MNLDPSFFSIFYSNPFLIPVIIFSAGALLLDIIYTIGQPNWRARETNPFARRFGAKGFTYSAAIMFGLPLYAYYLSGGNTLIPTAILGAIGGFHVWAFIKNYRQNRLRQS